jgi:hypothetical protein
MSRVRTLSGMTEKRTMRRWGPLPIQMAGILTVGVGLAIWANWRQPTGIIISEISTALAFCAFCYLAGPAARFVVARSAVTVENTFVRYRIPRDLVLGLDVQEISGVVLQLQDAAPISVRAAMPPMVRPTRRSLRSLRGEARELSELLGQVPPAPSVGPVEKRWRWGNIAVLVVTIIGAIAIYAYVFSRPS